MEAAAELIERVRLVCGSRHVLTDASSLSTYRSDGTRRNGPLPLAIVLPGDSSEVTGVVTACVDTGVPWTVRGAGTSTDGRALPQAGALMITLTRMRRVVSVNLEDDEVTVEPGVPCAMIDRLLAPSHSFPATPAGTIGGAVAQGMFEALVLGIDLVTSYGALVHARRELPGYDVAGAFIGSQGTRGIAVAVTLRAICRP